MEGTFSLNSVPSQILPNKIGRRTQFLNGLSMFSNSSLTMHILLIVYNPQGESFQHDWPPHIKHHSPSNKWHVNCITNLTKNTHVTDINEKNRCNKAILFRNPDKSPIWTQTIKTLKQQMTNMMCSPKKSDQWSQITIYHHQALSQWVQQVKFQQRIQLI